MKVKIIIVAGIIAFFAAVLAFILANWAIDPESYRLLVREQAVRAMNGRDVKMGAMELDLWPGIGFSVKNLRVAGREPEGSPLFRAELLVVRVAFWPLLKKRLEIRGIEAHSPQIKLVRLTTEDWNISDLLGSPMNGDTTVPGAGKKQPEGTLKNSKGRSLVLDRISITDGRILIEDKLDPERPPLEIILEELDLEDILSDAPIRMNLIGGLEGKPDTIEASGKLGPFSGENFKDRMEADLEMRFKELDLVPVLSWLPSDALPLLILDGTLSGKVKIKGKPKKPLKVESDLSISKLRYTNLKHTWPENKPATIGIKFTALIDREKDNVIVEPASLILSGSEVAVVASYERVSTKSPTLSVSAKARALDLIKILELVPVVGVPLKSSGFEAEGLMDLDLDLASPKDGPLRLSGGIDLTGAFLTLPGSFVKPKGKNARLETQMNLEEEKILFDKTSLFLGPLNMTGSGSIERDENHTTDIRLQSGPADTDAVLALFPSLSNYRLGGKLSLELALTGGLARKELVKLIIHNLEQDSESARFKLSAIAVFSSPTKISFSLDADSLNLDRIMGHVPKNAPSTKNNVRQGEGTPPKNKPSKKSSTDLSGYIVDGKINADKIILDGLHINNLSSNFTIKKGTLSTSDFRMSILGGSVSGPMSFDLNQDPMPGNISLALAGFRVESLLKKFTTYPPVITGEAKGNISLSFTGTSAGAIRRTARGKAGVEIMDGTLRGVDLVDGLLSQWAESDAVKKVIMQSLSPSIKTSVAEETRFKQMDAKLKIRPGTIEVKKSTLKLTEGKAVFKGAIGFDSSVDLMGKIYMSKKVTNQNMKEARKWVEKNSGGAIRGSVLDILIEDGRLILPFALKGTWPKPALTFNATAYGLTVKDNLKNQTPDKIIEQIVGKEQKKQIEEEVKKKIEEILGEEGKKLLDSIFPK